MVKMTGAATAILLALGVSGLAGCNSAPDNTTAISATGENGSPEDAKHAQYVSAYNGLAQNEYLARKAEAYASYNIPGATAASTMSMMFNLDYTGPIIDELKKARAADGGDATAPLDAAADKLIPELEAMVKIERELEPYYASRAYRADDFAKGKAADGPLKARYAAAIASFDQLGAALSVYERARNARRIGELTDAGHVAEASMVSAMAAAETMISAYSRGDMAAAARQAPAVSAAVDRMRANEGKLQKVAGNEHVYKTVLAQLTEMLGLFSDYRNGDQTARDRVLTKYNTAVSISNGYRFPA